MTSADWVAALAGQEGVRSIALLLESPGDGAALCEALARCAEEGIGVAVLKVGASAAGAAAAAAHTGAVAGDQRVFRALMAEAGAAWADDVHDLLELAKALAARGSRPRRAGLGVLTCSGGDSGLAADEAERRGVALPAFAGDTSAALRERLPAAATAANPLDHTAQQWGDSRRRARARPARRHRPRDRPDARVLRPAARPRRRRTATAGAPRPRGSSRAPRPASRGARRRHPARAARRRGRLAVRRGRRARRRRAAHRRGLRRRPRRPARRPGAPA